MNERPEAEACPVGGARPLTVGERALTRSMFGAAIDLDRVTIRRRRWFPLQPRGTVMAPCGHLHFHPHSDLWCEDFAAAPIDLQGLFIHEMVHVWQAQTRGWWYLPLVRPFSSRYSYWLIPGWGLTRYGIEQQAEIVRHIFLMRHGHRPAGAPPLKQYSGILPADWPKG